MHLLYVCALIEMYTLARENNKFIFHKLFFIILISTY